MQLEGEVHSHFKEEWFEFWEEKCSALCSHFCFWWGFKGLWRTCEQCKAFIKSAVQQSMRCNEEHTLLSIEMLLLCYEKKGACASEVRSLLNMNCLQSCCRCALLWMTCFLMSQGCFSTDSQLKHAVWTLSTSSWFFSTEGCCSFFLMFDFAWLQAMLNEMKKQKMSLHRCWLEIRQDECRKD